QAYNTTTNDNHIHTQPHACKRQTCRQYAGMSESRSTSTRFHIDPESARVKQDVSEPAFVQNPYSAYAHFHAHGGRVFWQDYGFWCFANYNDVNDLLRDKRFGREIPAHLQINDRPHLKWFDRVEKHSLLQLEPPEHTNLRRYVNRAFVSSQIERLRPEIETLCHDLIDAFEPEVDLLKVYATPIPLRVISSLMGVPQSLEPQLLEWSHAMCKLYTLKATAAEEAAANLACFDFHRALLEVIATKKTKLSSDLLGTLAVSGMSDDEIISTAVLLINAGHEATVHQTGNAVKVLLDPDFPERRAVFGRYSPAQIVEEALRFEAPLHLFTRYASEDVDFGDGVFVKKHEQIGLLLGAANRDPAAFVDADKFNPARSDQKNVSFGAGIHFCIGAPLARMELSISLKTLFERLPNMKL
ncbi:MAG: cytochrome P450, partial [Notoacmeibacter sp.]